MILATLIKVVSQGHSQVYEKIFGFTDARAADISANANKGSFPSGVVQGADGNFYGTTAFGGANKNGTIFKINQAGKVTTLVEFTGTGGGNKGSRPTGGVTLGADGNFYGTTSNGGSESVGTVFKMTPSGSLTTLVEFGKNVIGREPEAGLLLGNDGNFYGTTRTGGTNAHGTVFKITPSGVLTNLVEFTRNGSSNKGSAPYAGLVQGSDGNFYGSTSEGGDSVITDPNGLGYGTIFKMTPAGVLTTLIQFSDNGTSNKGRSPLATLAEGSDGNFYGSTSSGGGNGAGTVFKMTPAGVLTTLVEFTDNGVTNKGRGPFTGMVEGINGNFYGTTGGGGGGKQGTLFKMTPTGALTTLVEFSFDESESRGRTPSTTLVFGFDGNFYGATGQGGARDAGTFFKMTPAGVLTTLVHFTGDGISNIGSKPSSGLIQASDGNFYGTTVNGGSYNDGTIFMMKPSGELTTLVEFIDDGASDKGYFPSAGLLQDSDGNFYGTTSRGGVGGSGTVFKLTPSGVLTTLVAFGSGNGLQPEAGLVQGSDGNFYGTTSFGGANNSGTIFKMTPAGVLTTLVEFTGNGPSNKGSSPFAGLVQGNDGNFYGATRQGGASNNGTVFKMTSSGVLTTLVEFSGDAATNPGSWPETTLVQGSDGMFYGTTSNSGAGGFGTIFRMTSTGALSTLVQFTGNRGPSNIGSRPNGLVEGGDGNFYGTTNGGSLVGTVFKITPEGVLVPLLDFTPPDGSPLGPLIRATDGTLYGTLSGSNATDGAVFRLVFPGAPLVFSREPDIQSTTSAVLTSSANARGSATTVTLEYGTDGVNFPNSMLIGVNLTGFQTKVVGASVTGLIEGGIYYYRFRGVSSAGSTVSETVSFSTLAAPLATATTASEILPTSARFNGTVNARNYDTNIFFQWGNDGNSFPNTVAAIPVSVTGNAPVPVSALLAGLSPGQTIFYRVVATNTGGTSTSGNQSFRTLIPATAAITGATALSTTRALVNGLVDAEGGSADVSFEVGTDGINFPNSFSASPASVAGDSPVEVTATLTGLTQGTTYHVRIRAQGPGGTGLSPDSTFSLSILSGLVQVFPDPPPASGGSVTVNFSPPEIGAWRFAGDTRWLNSGAPYGNLASGQRVIEFLPIPGFISPPSETVDVAGSANLSIDGLLYYETPTTGNGSLTVRLKPDEISDLGVIEADRAQWRIVGEAAWRDGGTTLGNLVAGSYLVECKPVAGRETPPPIPVSLAAGDARDITLTYFTANTSAGSPPLPQSFADVSANEDMPFAHVGQIRTDVGSSSGFVVKRRVVATAGHVVFDDGTLSAVTGMRWFFQRHSGQHEPRPQVPRGSYLAAGYAAQRILDNSPGEGSAQSQDLDYAAIYFTEEAGRGGYGGYLASDSGDDNEFLGSTSEKILAGFPTSGIPEADSGKLHATTPFTPAISPAFGETWTTTAVRGFGGMSGGPLFVRHSTGTYFPAAIYLGGSGQTVVRAIDSGVVDLFLRAEVTGNGGDNNTDGGVTHTSVVALAAGIVSGSIQVNIEPAAARNSGGGWRLKPEDTSFRQSGFQKSALNSGSYILELATVADFQPPTEQIVTVTGGQLTQITYTYAPTVSQSPLETWRQTHFGTTANTGDAADDNDFDRDGESNLEEFTAGTHPKNGNDVFRMVTNAKSDNTFTTTCAGKTGRTYTLMRNTALSGTWTRLGSQGPLASDATVTLTDTTAPPDKCFYLIEVSIP